MISVLSIIRWKERVSVHRSSVLRVRNYLRKTEFNPRNLVANTHVVEYVCPPSLTRPREGIHKARINHLPGRSESPANALTVLQTIQNPQKMKDKSYRRFDSNPGPFQVI